MLSVATNSQVLQQSGEFPLGWGECQGGGLCIIMDRNDQAGLQGPGQGQGRQAPAPSIVKSPLSETV